MSEKTYAEDHPEMIAWDPPPEPKGENILMYKKFHGGERIYTYSGVRCRGFWYLSGVSSPQRVSWSDLMEWLRNTGPVPEMWQAMVFEKL